ncbi:MULTISPECIES: hypothetical protein [unclassified Paenibacillus]|uniref:hypothetical protein n=1 Tax=unclassified Paenibacillus TaxID=185978 RepID=UPI000CFDE158|nr:MULTISPECIES: hypothetical protein [unclassified Paenibacillus]MBD8838791.1 hypothetical protein [Paenibacillus sp. CFBP 13594]PRA08492.1 hypothetical protein CQ043_00375 [Paenibacillus sp. MYb63]PRA48426.1 hypothetical protein CQ061_08830 [Paenibacillus sp. MYb67]QZN78335.1 hypothetical protein K5K90_14760 [Paenibacillus sp. DR312]
MKHIRKMILAVLVSIAVIILIYNFTSNSEGRLATEPRSTPSTPLTVINNEDFAGTTNTHRFNIPAGFSYVKVSFKNRGSKRFTFTINERSTSGTEITSGSVPADGKEHTYYSDKALSTGWYYVSTSSAQGMSGTLDVSLGTDAYK